ncbi:branched-chain amino acid aminotransferase [Polytolypa hystricis UAMH7299]|uniref:Branched-chain amino acid aminotransferase n=1 Tax=Polytolypa hystricis (strain UAMH7299) TaxID=1447883 RepID=A0A2B7YFU5_POLH7|nr:branched-chain amino acid aminotransferase [Polytolypa hystricis UAMH7299]
MSFPPPPADIDWTKLSIAIDDSVNGHIESKYTVKTGEWSPPKFVADPYLRVHGLSTGLNYGQQIYEGLKAYRTASNKILLFRPSFHAKRMQHSAAVVSIPPVPTDHFLRCVRLAVAENASWVAPHSTGAALYVRPVVFGSSGHLALTRPSEYTLCVYVHPFGTYHGIAPLPALILEDFDRAAPMGTGNAKVGGNYAPVIRWQEQAMAEGFPMTLHLDSKTRSEIDEFSTSGFLGVKNGEDGKPVIVIPDTKNAIESVTSASCVEIARSLGWTVEIRPIKYEELPIFNEVMAVGTAAALVPIKSITCKSRGDKFVFGEEEGGATKAGPVCSELYSQLNGIQRGDRPDNFAWCEEVGPVEESNGVSA